MTKETSPKDRKLRHAEYYGMTEIFDKIYSKSLKGDNFKNLMQIIISDNNIVLAYRNIKRNHGSVTRGEFVGRENRMSFIDEGTPYAVKVARTVWTGGKDGDNIKLLPISIYQFK